MSTTPEKTPMTEFIGVPFDELPQTNPPREYRDIGHYLYGRPEGQELFTAPDPVLENPDLLNLWKVLVTEAKKNDLVVVEGYVIRRAMDGAEIDRQIAEKRRKYEEERQKFHSIINGEYPHTPMSYSVDLYLNRESIAWDQNWVDENYQEEDKK